MDKISKKSISSSARAYNRLNLLGSINLEFDYDVYRIYEKCKFKDSDLGYSVSLKYQADFKAMVKTLAIKYKLSALPFKVLSDYILDKDFVFKEMPNFSLSDDRQDITYKIYTDTTRNDILSDWPKIKKLQEKINGRKIKKQYPLKNFHRDFNILFLHENGKANKKIYKIINKKFPKTTISYEDIPKIIERLRSWAR